MFGRPTFCRHLVSSLTLAAATFTQWAAADAPPASGASSSAPTGTVAEHLRRGEQARKAARWADAASAYRAALDAAVQTGLSPEKRAAILGELGLVELALGKHRDAAEHLQASLQHHDALPREQRQRFREGQKKAEREIGMLFVSVDPPDAEVLVDGVSLGARRASYLVFVEPGTHVVRGRLSGHGDFVGSVEAPRGGWQSMALRLPNLAPVSKPAAIVPTALPPRHSRPAAKQTPEASPSLAPLFRGLGFGAASASVAVGVAFAIAAEDLGDQMAERSSALGPSACALDGSRAECRVLRELYDRRDVFAGVATGSFIAGAVIGAASISSFWWAPGARSAVQVQPVMGRQVGVVVTHLF